MSANRSEISMTPLQMRKKISDLAENNTEAATKLALQLTITEPNEAVNYKNLAICFARSEQSERAIAALRLGKSKTSEDSAYWFSVECSILIFCNLMDQLTDLLLSEIREPTIPRHDIISSLRENRGRLKVDLFKSQLKLITSRLDQDDPLIAELAVFFYAHKEWALVKCLLQGFGGEGNLDHEGKKELSILYNKGEVCSKAKDLLLDLIANPKSKEEQECDLIELTFVYAKFGDIQGAINCLDRILAENPGHAEALRCKTFYLHYHDVIDIEAIRETSQRYGEQCRPQISSKKLAPVRQRSRPRIGLLSSNFKSHPVGFMTCGFFTEAPNFEQIAEVHVLATAQSDDQISNRIRFSGNIYHDLSGHSPTDLTDFIQDLGLDILVDLEGMSVNSPLSTCISKPAPILINWVGGLIGSMWLQEYDYLITDFNQTPLGFESDFSEQLVRLPHCYVTYMPMDHKLEQQNAPCETNKFVTFGSFNNCRKISQTCLDVWSRVLVQTPNSKILLKDKTFADDGITSALIQRFDRLGIDADRVQFAPPSDHENHLKSMQKVDIALDSMPYTGGLTTIEALYMGVPVIGLAGRLLCHRHSTTHLSSTGHPELIAKTHADYVEKAVALVTDHQRIINYRRTLKDDVLESPLLDHKEFTEIFLKKMATLVS